MYPRGYGQNEQRMRRMFHYLDSYWYIIPLIAVYYFNLKLDTPYPQWKESYHSSKTEFDRTLLYLVVITCHFLE